MESTPANAKEPVIVAWSGGKDSGLALHEILRSELYEAVALLTTFNQKHQRVSMHGLRLSLVQKQALSLGLRLKPVFISDKASNEQYEEAMKDALLEFKAKGVETVVHGDIFLEGVRAYREENLARLDMRAHFPLWGQDTAFLAERLLKEGFRAAVSVVDSHALDRSFSGREFNRYFLEDLPPGVDPCGENGEFHTYLYDGPDFNFLLPHHTGEIVLRDERFYFCDFLD